MATKDCSQRQVSDGVFEFSNTELDGVIDQLLEARDKGEFEGMEGAFTLRLVTRDLAPSAKQAFISRP